MFRSFCGLLVIVVGLFSASLCIADTSQVTDQRVPPTIPIIFPGEIDSFPNSGNGDFLQVFAENWIWLSSGAGALLVIVLLLSFKTEFFPWAPPASPAGAGLDY
ncbi:MAG: hypothetical protein ACJAU6_003121 [Alphaproteobacteria bacterium]|jgi:hypothetical protein